MGKNVTENCNKIKLLYVLDGKISNYFIERLGKFQLLCNLLHPRSTEEQQCGFSQTVTHPSTSTANCCLTSIVVTLAFYHSAILGKD